MEMSPTTRPLIVGAGPVGLAAALFLARSGRPVRIIDAAPGPSRFSKALAVNPRTLEILEPTGITAEMLALGKPIRGARFWHRRRVVAQFQFAQLHHKYPYMLALSQAATVGLLESSLKRCGVQVEWGLRLIRCRNRSATEVEAVLKTAADGPTQTLQCPWLLAADGAHSTARKELAVAFEGNTFERQWHLVDVPLETSLADDCAHVIFLDGGGFLFAIRVVEGTEAPQGVPPVWRVMGNVPDVLNRLEATPAGAPLWESSFNISHRINARMQDGHIYFAGDAAHIHSPVGARGMNLGIEDVWVFSELLRQDQLSSYGPMRRKIDHAVVKRIERVSRLARGESLASRVLRATVLPLLSRIPPVRRRLIATVTGLDHPLCTTSPMPDR